MDEETNWEDVWDARLAGMVKFFGPNDDSVLHSAIPFEVGQDLGGSPDVVTFSQYANGILYVTADLIGSKQIPNADGQYELAILHPEDEEWGYEIICALAYYSLESPMNAGDTMDIGEATPEDSALEGLLFRQIAGFEVLGQPASVLCCVGLTENELRFCQEHGSAKLIETLGDGFLVTDLNRASLL